MSSVQKSINMYTGFEVVMQQTLKSQYKVELHRQIIKLCHNLELPLHSNKYGSKKFNNYQRVALLILYRRGKDDYREFVEKLPETKWPEWLGLKDIPSYRSVHEWNHKFGLDFVRTANKTVLKDEKPKAMSVDATGFDSWQRSRHYEKRLGEAPMPYAKADFFVDIDTFLIHDFILRVKPRHDTIGAKTFFKRCSYKNIFVPMDKAYDSEPLHELAEQKGIISYAPVRNFCVRKPRGKHRRRCFQERPEQASRRCLIESTIRSLKSRFRTLRSRKHFLKKRELGWQVLVYNLRILAKNAKAFLELLYQATILNRAKKREDLKQMICLSE